MYLPDVKELQVSVMGTNGRGCRRCASEFSGGLGEMFLVSHKCSTRRGGTTNARYRK